MTHVDHADTLARLLPPVAYDPQATTLQAELQASAAVLDAAFDQVLLLLREIDPRFTYNLLELFEHNFGVPDYCADLALTVEDRRLAVLQKLIELGGQTPAYFEAIARALGYDDAKVVEYFPWTCVDLCTDPLCDDTWRLTWAIQTALNERVTFFTCVSPCVEPLRNWALLEPLICVMRKLKPAHTHCYIDLGI